MPEPAVICGFRGGGKYSVSPASGPGEPKSLRFRAPAHAGNSRRRVAVIPSLGVLARMTRMRPRDPSEEDRGEDLFRSRLANMLAPRHELLRLAALVDWGALDAAFGQLYARPGAPAWRRG